MTHTLPSLAEIEAAAAVVYRFMPPTPQYCWPSLSARCECDVWVKHENHTPTGAFKIRGGLTYIDNLIRIHPKVQGVVTATRGNHGQSIATAARHHGLSSTIIVPEGNSLEKNAAMKAQGAILIEHGHDFQAAREYAHNYAIHNNLHLINALETTIIHGVATYALEFLKAVPDLHTVFVPIGQGSGICDNRSAMP
ncbi:MAG: pyridoxal-phosphate dependent enzyme [Alphaproteobacteria bacterium]